MTIERLLPFMILVTIGLSALLLGMGQGDFEPFIVAVLGAVAAFALVDGLKWFCLPQWLANLLAIIVTIVTVSNFYFTNDSVRHLLGVGKLLVYLQTILLFQRKSSRVYWQVMVLGLLQIVVGAVFNLGFEGGVLFIGYMMVAGITMMLLHLYQGRQQNRFRNEDYGSFANNATLSGVSRPIAVSRNPVLPSGVMRRMVGSFGVFAVGALVFSILLFYFLPRDRSSWSGPDEVEMRMTGFDKKVDMSHTEMILLSTKLQMNVRYWHPGKEEPYEIKSQPYLRGIALNNIEIEDNKTKWVPPPYQVYDSDFRPLRTGNEIANWIVQEVVLEPTDDPLLYTAIPPRVTFNDELLGEYEWCWTLGGLTRQRSDEKIAVAHYRYDLKIPVLPNGDFHQAWPYVARDSVQPLTQKDDPGNFEWLTNLDKERYPTIVKVAQQLADRVTDGNHYSLAQEMESWFFTDRFSYTLDFRNVKRDETLDPIEDFFANFQKGHCEYFASALALMLRSQGVPARLVVGYRGGDVNGFGGHLDVEAKHAHAWVEAYIRPADCPEQLIRTGQASRKRGAWLRLDPTPSVDLNSLVSGNDDAMDFAKSLWRDYVLGLQSETRSRVITSNGQRIRGLLKFLDLGWWQQSFDFMMMRLKQPGGWRNYIVQGLVLIGILLALMIWFLKFLGSKAWSTKSSTVAGGKRSGSQDLEGGWLRRKIAGALNSVSPGLGDWVAAPASDTPQVAFYQRMLKALRRAGFERAPEQTPREFAQHVSSELQIKLPDSDDSKLASTITELYYRVRYGGDDGSGQGPDSQQHAVAEKAVGELENCLKRIQG